MARRSSVAPYPDIAALQRTFTKDSVTLGGVRRFLASEGLAVFAAQKEGVASVSGRVWLRPSAYRRMSHYLDLSRAPSVCGFRVGRSPQRAQMSALPADPYDQFRAAAETTKGKVIDGDRRTQLRACCEEAPGDWSWAGQIDYEHVVRLADGQRIASDATVELFAKRGPSETVDVAVVVNRPEDFSIAEQWLSRAVGASHGWNLGPFAMREDALIEELKRIETALSQQGAIVRAWSNPHIDRAGQNDDELEDHFLMRLRTARYETEMLTLDVVAQRMHADRGSITHLTAFVQETTPRRIPVTAQRVTPLVALRLAQKTAEAHLFLNWHLGRGIADDQLASGAALSRDLWDLLMPLDWDHDQKRDYLLARWSRVVQVLDEADELPLVANG